MKNIDDIFGITVRRKLICSINTHISRIFFCKKEALNVYIMNILKYNLLNF